MKNIIVVAMVMLAGIAYGQDRTLRADARERMQQARIQDGRRDGSLTRRESAGLAKEQRSIRRGERRAKADGEVSFREKRRLERKQDRANRHIRRQKHDAQVRARSN